MYDDHEEAVRIAFYHDWNKEEGSSYYVAPLCDECAAEREGDVGEVGNPDDGVGWRCEECNRPNLAELGLKEEGGIY